MGDNKRYGNIKSENSNRVAEDIKNMEKRKNYRHFDKADLNIFEIGMNWYNNGLSLDEAPLELKNNSNFINGFNKAKRLELIAELKHSQTGRSK